MRASPNALPWLLVSAAVIVLDQLSKAWVLASLPEYTAVPVIDGFWNWYRSYNTGAAFSFLSDAGGWQKWFFMALAFGVSGLLATWLARTPRREWRTALPFALVIGGALGNVIDRIRFGAVFDFLDFYVGNWHWPAFNVADSCITVGVVLLLWDGLFHGQERGKS